MLYRVQVIPRIRKRRVTRKGEIGRTPYGLQVIESCLACPLVKERIFCDLPGPVLAKLDEISSSATYPKDAILFVEGQEPNPYELTAEALEPLQANFIPRDTFLLFLQEHGEAALRVAEMLARTYHVTLAEVRYLGLSASTAEKLARFLLGLPATQVQSNGQMRTSVTLTHREIAEMIGASRETVTRLFTTFERERLLEVHGSTLIITNRAGLEKLVEG